MEEHFVQVEARLSGELKRAFDELQQELKAARAALSEERIRQFIREEVQKALEKTDGTRTA